MVTRVIAVFTAVSHYHALLHNDKYFLKIYKVTSKKYVQTHKKVYRYFMFVFPCIITLYYIKNKQDTTLAVLFISHCKITQHVSDTFCVHHQEYLQL